MPNILKPRSLSFSAKIALTLIVLAFFLLSILFILIIPKMEKEQLKYTKEQIEKIIQITKEQVDVAGKSIAIQAKLEKSETKYKIETILFSIKESSKNFEDSKKLLQESKTINQCSYILKNEDEKFEKIEDKRVLKNFKTSENNIWTEFNSDLIYRSLNRKSKYFTYTTKLNYKDTKVTLICASYALNKNHKSFEEDIKKNVQKTFSLMEKFHKGKSYLIWINPNHINENTRPLYRKIKEERKKIYSISNMSAVQNIHTGDLTAKQINENKDKEPIEHLLNGKKALTWVSNLSEEGDSYIFLLITTIFLDDLYNHVDSSFWKIFPAALLALSLAILVGFYLLKRQFISISKLAFVAKQINNGNTKTRSEVKGNDDIGMLGIAFDNMIDNFENNIKILDEKVEEKTKELKLSLEEKEVLLKEIHHRVKNNLALTISLIKLQQAKIEDIKTKSILVDIQERIYTMELLHRKLYQSSNLNSINFKEYIQTLVNDIKQTYNYDKEIELSIKIEDVFLNIEEAMPCGLILNELITNSFKYAFKETKKPKLCIHMKKDEDNYKLIYKDNGQGLPKNINMDNPDTLGLKLIKSIAKLQLDGTLSYKNKKGLKFKITF